MKTNVASLADMGDEGSRVLASVRAETLDEIERVARVGWLPVELDVELTQAVDRALGRQAVESWSRDSIQRSFEGPLLGPILDGAIRIFGLEPGLILKLAPRAWSNIYRDCGRLEWVGISERRAELHLGSAPAVIVDSDAYLASIAASFAAIFDVTRCSGHVTIHRLAPSHVVFDLEWSRR